MSRNIKTIYFSTIFGVFFYVFNMTVIAEVKSAEVVDRIVAVVNNDIITLTGLNRLFKPYEDKRYTGKPEPALLGYSHPSQGEGMARGSTKKERRSLRKRRNYCLCSSGERCK